MRHKARKVLEDQKGTGGGPSKAQPLTDIEERALSLWGKAAVFGNKINSVGLNVPETSQSVDIEDDQKQNEVTISSIDTPILNKRKNQGIFLFYIKIVFLEL